MICKFLFKCSVPMILDRIVCSTSQSAGDLTPLVPDVTLQLNYKLLLFRSIALSSHLDPAGYTTFRHCFTLRPTSRSAAFFHVSGFTPFCFTMKLTFCPRPVSTSPGWPFSQPLELWKDMAIPKSSGNERAGKFAGDLISSDGFKCQTRSSGYMRC